MTTSPEKLTALAMRLAAPGSAAPAGLPGDVEGLVVRADGASIEVEADVRRTDLRAARGDVERRRVALPAREGELDLAGLQAVLRELKAADPSRRRATLLPSDDLPAADLVRLVDAMRSDPSGELFPQVTLGALR